MKKIIKFTQKEIKYILSLLEYIILSAIFKEAKEEMKIAEKLKRKFENY